jgi:hypothetical protein
MRVACPYISGYRKSECTASSPGALLDELKIRVTVQGEMAENAFCIEEVQPYGPYTSDWDEYVHLSGSTETLVAGAWFNITSHSFRDSLSGEAEWSYISWTPPMPPGGTTTKGPFTNDVGPCY